ncbi:MAG: PH domain-containing protein [Pseudomonadota bacterium]
MDQEQTIWKGTPSQYINLKAYILCVLAAAVTLFVSLSIQSEYTERHGEDTPSYFFILMIAGVIIPLVIALWKAFTIKANEYILTNQRFISKVGLFGKHTDEIELYRIKDYHIEQPFFFRLFNIGTIILETSDRTHPTYTLRGVPHPEQLRDNIRTNVEHRRNEGGRVREIEMT